MSQVIDIEVDTELFPHISDNTYVTEQPKGAILTMLVPETYEGMREDIEENQDLLDVTESGEKEINGVKVLYQFGISEAEGSTMKNYLYCVKYEEDVCLMFVGLIEEKADEKYYKAIENAANSVIKNYTEQEGIE